MKKNRFGSDAPGDEAVGPTLGNVVGNSIPEEAADNSMPGDVAGNSVSGDAANSHTHVPGGSGGRAGGVSRAVDDDGGPKLGATRPIRSVRPVRPPHTIPTIRDIARAAGVSPTTVSVVINGRQRETRISDETVKRVWQAVQQYGYRPDHSARSLRRRATQLIGVAVSWLQDPFYPELSACIGRVCREHGYGMFLTDLPDWVESTADHELGNSSVDGVILADTRRSPWHPGGKVVDPAQSTVPTVMVMGQEWLAEWHLPVNGAHDPHVVLLQTEQAGRLAARHLWERGYRRFVYVPAGFAPQLSPGHREFGFYDELHRLGVSDPDAIYMAPLVQGQLQPQPLPGYWSARAVVQSNWWQSNAGERVGFYAANDTAGVEVLRTLHEAGVSVPEQAGVVGTNGTQLGLMAFPPLTSISLNVEAIAEEAVDRLLRLIHGVATAGVGARAGDAAGDESDESSVDDTAVDGSVGVGSGTAGAAGVGASAGETAGLDAGLGQGAADAQARPRAEVWLKPSLLIRGST
ncbi:MAG: LacI family DNA-binding transcriptional regulator [Limnochordaceae bacterium]|nr:LacI family DNA-binding transcriptional regulator [Limnochordaceae bacterium]